jgi:hypothetical protein
MSWCCKSLCLLLPPLGATTLSMTTLNIMTFSITTLRIMTFCITTLSLTILCHCDEYSILFIKMLNVIMQSVVRLNAVAPILH